MNSLDINYNFKLRQTSSIENAHIKSSLTIVRQGQILNLIQPTLDAFFFAANEYTYSFIIKDH